MTSGRKIPKSVLRKAPKGYAKLVAQRFDYYQESIEVELSSDFVRHLDDGRERAGEVQGDKAVALLRVGAEMFQVGAHGLARGGYRWVLRNDDMLLLIRGPGERAFKHTVTARYLAAGLWEYEIDELRARVVALLKAVRCRVGERIVNRVDYAFDFDAPRFERDMVPGISAAVVAHSSVKVRSDVQFAGSEHGTSRRVETLTIGSKVGLEVQVYDKTVELKQKPGKEWMYDVWRANSWEGGKVWRLEFRFGAEYLKDRSLRQHDKVIEALPSMITEAVATRRLTVPRPGDTNERRWPLHPLWALALEQVDAEFMPALGRQFTNGREDHAAMLYRQAAGTLCSAVVCRDGTYSATTLEEMIEDIRETLESSPSFERDNRAREDRYAFMEAAS